MDKDMEEFLGLLSDNNGLATYVIKESRFTYSQYKQWLKDNEFRLEVEFINECKKDFMESKILEAVDSNSNQVLVHIAKTMLADRGYSTEKQSQDIGDIFIGFSDEE